jgi:hypothetical protein
MSYHKKSHLVRVKTSPFLPACWQCRLPSMFFRSIQNNHLYSFFNLMEQLMTQARNWEIVKFRTHGKQVCITRNSFVCYQSQNYGNFRGYIQEFPTCTLHAHVIQPVPCYSFTVFTSLTTSGNIYANYESPIISEPDYVCIFRAQFNLQAKIVCNAFQVYTSCTNT